MITAERFRALCLGLHGASEVPHFDRAAFRVRKMFATLPPDGRTANLLLVPELQAAVVDAMPHAFSPVAGGWGRMGYTTVDLARVSEDELVPVLRESHALASEPPKKKPKASTVAAKRSSTAAKTSRSEGSPAKKATTTERSITTRSTTQNKSTTKKSTTKKSTTKKAR